MLILVTIYRLLFVPASSFMKDFSDFLEILSVMPEDFTLAGDINFHLETCDYQVEALRKLWSSFNLVQHVDIPTHKLGHTLDLVLTRCDSVEIRNLVAKDVQLSDHYMVSFDLEAAVLQHETKTITYRNLKSVNCEQFSRDLQLKL